MKNLKKLREQANVSQCELAEYLKVNQSFISQLERGLSDCTFRKAKEIAFRLNVSLDQLDKE